jgi:hypothetical protein
VIAQRDRLIRGLACFLSLFLLVRWSPEFIQTASGDPAYTYSYHHIFLTGAQYGIDVLHTGGPWSILYFHLYHPDTFLLSIFGQAIMALILGLVIGEAATRYLQITLLRIAFVLWMLALFTIAVDARYFFLALAAIALMPNFRHQRYSSLHFAVLSVIALSVLIKSSFFVTGAIVLIATMLQETLRDRKIPIHAIAFVILVIVLHLFSGQDLSGLIAYFAAIIEVGRTYSEFVSELGSYWELIAFWFFALILAVLVVTVEIRRTGRWGLITSIAYAAIVFIAYKQGFIRQDGQHVIRSFCTIFTFGTFYALLYLTVLKEFSVADIVRGSKAIHATAAICLVMAVGVTGFEYPSLYSTKLERLRAQISDIWNLGTTGLKTFNSRHKRAKSQIRADFPIPPLDGSLAVFSSLQTAAIAHPIEYSILPTTAAQLIWTPKQDAANAALFSGAESPKFIAGDLPYTNRRSGLAMLTHYQPHGFFSGMYLLKRGDKREVTNIRLATSTISWGQRLDIPVSNGGLIVAKIQYKRTLWGALLNFLYQPAPAYLVIHNEKGTTSRDLIGRGIAQQGLLLSPDPGSIVEFSAMTTKVGRNYMSDREAVALHMEAGNRDSWLFPLDQWARYFQPDITVAFERVTFPNETNFDWKPESQEMASFKRLLSLRPRDPSGRTPSLQLTPDGRAGILLRAGNKLRVPLDPAKRRLTVLTSMDVGARPFPLTHIEILLNGETISVQSAKIESISDSQSDGRITVDYGICGEVQNCDVVISVDNRDIDSTAKLYILDLSTFDQFGGTRF